MEIRLYARGAQVRALLLHGLMTVIAVRHDPITLVSVPLFWKQSLLFLEWCIMRKPIKCINEGIILFKSLSKEDKKRIKDIFVPGYELEVAVQEIDEELKKIILNVDFSDFLDSSSDDSENE